MKKSPVLHRAPAVALLLVSLGSIGCKSHSSAPSSMFPAANEVEGWARTSDIRTFAAGDLWKYIDGDAEKYLKAGVKNVATADYTFKGRIEAVVDVYTMGDVDGAKKIFESEPDGGGRQATVGDAARSSGQSLVFLRGPYLVRIVAYQESPETQLAILQLGLGLEKRLGS
jgi:hypothetical protein